MKARTPEHNKAAREVEEAFNLLYPKGFDWEGPLKTATIDDVDVFEEMIASDLANTLVPQLEKHGLPTQEWDQHDWFVIGSLIVNSFVAGRRFGDQRIAEFQAKIKATKENPQT